MHVTVEEERNLIQEFTSQANHLFIVAFTQNKIIGNLIFRPGRRPRTKHCGEFGLTIRKEYWNQGLGSELLRILIAWAKSRQIIRKINLHVRSDNASAIHLYEKMGFCHEGCEKRAFLIDGQFYDLNLMGLLL